MGGKRGVYFTGVGALQEKLRENATMEDVKTIVKKNTSEMETKMKRNASFRGHWDGYTWVSPTGFTKRSIQSTITKDGMQGGVAPGSEYSFYLEYGTRFMSSAQPFVGPAYRNQKPIFISDMKRLVQ